MSTQNNGFDPNALNLSMTDLINQNANQSFENRFRYTRPTNIQGSEVSALLQPDKPVIYPADIQGHRTSDIIKQNQASPILKPVSTDNFRNPNSPLTKQILDTSDLSRRELNALNSKLESSIKLEPGANRWKPYSSLSDTEKNNLSRAQIRHRYPDELKPRTDEEKAQLGSAIGGGAMLLTEGAQKALSNLHSRKMKDYQNDFDYYLKQVNKNITPDLSETSSQYPLLTADLYQKPEEQDYLNGMPSLAEADKEGGGIMLSGTKGASTGAGLGGTIGGIVGSAIASGAATGSTAGSAAGPIGTAIGALVGVIGGLIAGGVKRHKAKEADQDMRDKAIEQYVQDLEKWKQKRQRVFKRVRDDKQLKDFNRREGIKKDVNQRDALISANNKGNIQQTGLAALTKSRAGKIFDKGTNTNPLQQGYTPNLLLKRTIK